MRINQVKSGVMLSYASILLSTVISLIYTPIMLSHLGTSEYGVYNVVLPIISYLNLLNFGLGSAYVRYSLRAMVEHDHKRMAKLNGMFFSIYLILGTLILVIGSFLAYHGDVVFGKKLTADEIALGKTLLQIMSITAAISMPLTIFDSNVMIHERYVFQKIVAMTKSVLNPLLCIPLLLIGFRSIAITLVALAVTLLCGGLNVFYCVRKLDMTFSFRFRRADFLLMRDIFGYTLYVFIGIIVDEINWGIDRLMLGWLHGTFAVTIYVVGAQLNLYYLSFANAISGVLTPRVHKLIAAKRPMSELDDLFIRIGRIQFILMVCILLGFVAVGRPFVIRWAGGSEYGAAYYIALILFLTTLFPSIQNIGLEIQRAKNMHKFRSLVYFAVAIGNILLTIPLARRWQGLGAAIGTVIATIIGNVILMNWYYHKHIGLDIPRFWKNIVNLIPSMLLPAAAAVLIALFAPVLGYLSIVLWGAIFVVIYGLTLWRYGLNPYEHDLITGLLARILPGKTGQKAITFLNRLHR